MTFSRTNDSERSLKNGANRSRPAIYTSCAKPNSPVKMPQAQTEQVGGYLEHGPEQQTS